MIASQAATALIGRQAELAAVTAHLLDPACRLLTLVGPAGCGKTSLASHAAQTIAPAFDNNVIWCDLATVTNDAYVPFAVAAGLGLAEQTDRPLADTLADHLRDQKALLILDNCEHLLAAVARMVDYLMRHCQRLQFLLTSLFATGLPAETAWPVPPLPTPVSNAPMSPAVAEASPAVLLFVARAEAVLPGFSLTAHNVADVVAVCRRLDGLPLAIELAAARLRLLTPAQISARLDDALPLLSRRAPNHPSRHQTLRAMMDWTYGLLSEAERELLQRLSLFAGPFDVDMVEGVFPEIPGILDLLTDLLDKSLLMAEPGPALGESVARFRLLEVVRQYVRERLEEAGQADDALEHLLAWAVRYAERAAVQLTGNRRGEWLSRLRADYPTMRVALRWAASYRRTEAGLRLSGALFRYWFSQGALSEGRAWLDEMLALDSSRSPAVRAWALFAAGRLALRQWDVDGAERRGAESLALYRVVGDTSGTAWALSLMALVAQERYQPEQAVACYEEALAISRRLDEPYLRAVLLHNLGLFHHERGEYDRAESLYKEAQHLIRQSELPDLGTAGNLAEILTFRGEYAAALKLAQANLERGQALNDLYTVAQENLTLGLISYCLGELEAAHRHYDAALALHRGMNTFGGIGFALAGLADVALTEGRAGEAAALYGEALQLFDQLDQGRGLAWTRVGLGRVAADAGQPEQAMAHLLPAWQLAERSGAVTIALTAVSELAGILAHRGRQAEAARLLAAVAARRQDLGVPAPPVEQARLQAVAARAGSSPTAQTVEAAVSWADLVAEYLPALSHGSPAGEPPPVAVTREPEMRAYLLGPVELWLHGRQVSATDWTYHKARELYFYLLAQPPANKEQIGLALWPDASAEQLRNEFHRTLYYLRRAIGKPDWVQYADRCYRLDPAARLWCDLHEFEDSLRAVRALRRPGGVAVSDRPEVVAALEAATGLWRGDFLTGMPVGDWAIERGEGLRQVYLQALLDLGQLHLIAADYGQAEEVYQRVLTLDSFVELAHRELMRCYGRQGDRSRAIRHYQSLSRLLRDELHTSPSPETRLLFERLRRGDEV